MHSDKTKQKILKTSEKLFLRQGYRDTTIQQISKEAGCNPALLHYYFGSKESIFSQVFEQKLTALAQAINASVQRTPAQPSDCFIDFAVAFAGAQFDLLHENDALVRFFLRELSFPDKRLRTRLMDVMNEHLGRYFKQMEAKLLADVEAGKVRPISFCDFIFDTVSLNLAPFLLQPGIKTLMGMTTQQYNQTMALRREEIVHLIKVRLQLPCSN